MRREERGRAHVGNDFGLPCGVGKGLPLRQAGENGNVQLMHSVKHFAAQSPALLQLVRNQGTIGESFSHRLRLLEELDGILGGTEIENGRPARQEYPVGAEHDGPRRLGKSGRPVDDKFIRIGRQFGDATNYLFRLIKGFKWMERPSSLIQAEADCCGSASMKITLRLLFARKAAKWTAIVVLPTPPLEFVSP